MEEITTDGDTRSVRLLTVLEQKAKTMGQGNQLIPTKSSPSESAEPEEMGTSSVDRFPLPVQAHLLICWLVFSFRVPSLNKPALLSLHFSEHGTGQIMIFSPSPPNIHTKREEKCFLVDDLERHHQLSNYGSPPLSSRSPLLSSRSSGFSFLSWGGTRSILLGFEPDQVEDF